MRRTVVGVVAVVTATSLFTLTGLGMAEAASMIPDTHATAAGFSPTAEATTLSTLHDSLASQWKARDTGAMRTTQTALAGELAKLRAPQGKAAMTSGAETAATRATRQNTELGDALAAPPGDAPGDAAAAAPPAPDPGSLVALVQGLLSSLLSVVSGLLGGLPAPPPAPPSVPATPPAAPPAAAPVAG
jgi:hypothetical protein